MGPDLEIRGIVETPVDKSEALMYTSPRKESVRVPLDSEAKIMQCLSNCEDNDFDMDTLCGGQTLEVNRDSEVDITDCKNSVNIGLLDGGCGDTTEHSSSFGDTSSETENHLAVSAGEVESEYSGGDIPGLYVNGYSELYPIRKKKLTDDWRRFIQPLKWRCKWLELQICELNSQARKYDRKLAEYNQKECFSEKPDLKDVDAKSRAFHGQFRRGRVMKRRRRRRVEEMVDIDSYMSRHNFFSYYGKKPLADPGLVEICHGNDGINDGLDFGDGSNSLEQILAKIETAQSHVCKLKARIDKVISENPGKFSSVNRLSMFAPKDELTSHDQNKASPPKSGLISPIKSLYNVSQHVSHHDGGNMFLPETAHSTLGEATPLPDIIESTNQTTVEVPCDMSDDETPNYQPEEESLDVEKFRNQLIMERPEDLVEMHEIVSSVSASKADFPAEISSLGEASSLKCPPITKTYVRNKCRRRSRRGPARKWSRRLSG